MSKFLIVFFCFFTAVFCMAAGAYEQIYENYFSLSNALAKDSVPDAKKAAGDLSKSAALFHESTDFKSLPKGEMENFRQSMATISTLSKTITTLDQIDKMRKPFEEMTTLLMRLKSTAKVQTDEYYCPMVKKNWLQKAGSKAVMNPYGGKEMQNCGEKKGSSK